MTKKSFTHWWQCAYVSMYQLSSMEITLFWIQRKCSIGNSEHQYNLANILVLIIKKKPNNQQYQYCTLWSRLGANSKWCDFSIAVILNRTCFQELAKIDWIKISPVKKKKKEIRSEKILYMMFKHRYWFEMFSNNLTTRDMCLLLDKFDEFFYPYNVTQNVADGT